MDEFVGSSCDLRDVYIRFEARAGREFDVTQKKALEKLCATADRPTHTADERLTADKRRDLGTNLVSGSLRRCRGTLIRQI